MTVSKNSSSPRANGYDTAFADELYLGLFYGLMLTTFQLAVLFDRKPASIRQTCRLLNHPKHNMIIPIPSTQAIAV